jgi:hypothetical protein
MNIKLELKSKRFNLGNNRTLLIGGAFILLFTMFSNFPISLAQDTALGIYKDKKNYFTFSPPADWNQEEIVNDTVSQVNFRSPDGKVALGVIAELNEGDLNDLFFQKKNYVKDFQRRFPKGKFSASWATLGNRKVIRVVFEMPQVVKQEQYFFYDQGIRFDLVYGVADPTDFKKYHQLALDAFATVQRSK